jgi:hypothetical protein
MHLESTSAASRRQRILYEDARLGIEEEWQLAYREGRQPRTSAVLRRVLELNPKLTRRTARLVCAIGLYLSPLASEQSKLKLRAVDPDLRRWLETNLDPTN